MENEQIIFRTKNDQNMIIEREDCYLLRAPKGEAVFDKKKSVLKAVIDAIKQHGNAKWSTAKGCGFRFQDKDCNFICSLSQVVYCAYNRLSVSELSGRRLWYVDGNPFNLRKDNIVMPNKQSVEYISVFGKRYILLRTYAKNQKCHWAITNGDPGLLDLLSSLPWQFHKDGSCLRTTVNRKHVKLYYVVWAYFHCGDVTKENLAEKIVELQTYMSENKMSIDHKKASHNNERNDNRVENLQLIPKTLNSSKGNGTSRLHGDLFYIPTNGGEMYGHYDWTNGYINFCENEGDATVASIDQLRRFYKTGEFQETDNHYRIPLDSPKGMEIQQADFRETKLYLEVLIYD